MNSNFPLPDGTASIGEYEARRLAIAEALNQHEDWRSFAQNGDVYFGLSSSTTERGWHCRRWMQQSVFLGSTFEEAFATALTGESK